MKTTFACSLVLTLLFNTGCESAREYSLTSRLWQNMQEFQDPAPDPRLELYAGPKDVLVKYDELKRDGAPQRRAYWLLASPSGRKPHFISEKKSEGLTLIPLVYAESANETNRPGPFALVSTNRQEFTLHISDKSAGPYSLPAYEKSRAARIALTPLAVVGDATIVGAICGALMVRGGANPN